MRIVKLKTRVHEVPGIETLTMQMLAGRRNDSMNGRLAMTKCRLSNCKRPCTPQRTTRLQQCPQSLRRMRPRRWTITLAATLDLGRSCQTLSVSLGRGYIGKPSCGCRSLRQSRQMQAVCDA
jgi:hypothetical protein